MLLLRTSRGVDPGIPLLRSLGSNAHVWLPGASGVSVASLPSNNYLLSDGSTGYSTVDGVDGLTLDGMGTLGSELITGATAWVPGAGLTIAGGVVTGTGTVATLHITPSNATLTIGRTYVVTMRVLTCTAGQISTPYDGFGANMQNAIGTYTDYFVAATRDVYIYSNGFAGTADNISVKEYTGIHLTQATTANKPLVRRGMLNELLNSATPATQSVTCIAAPYTLALYGTGNVVLSGTGAGTLTGTGASDLVVLNFTPTAGSVTFTKAGTVSSFGLFKGTWTAAQILAEGGIPTTTATAASNSTSGKYWWSFDGSNDSLLSGNLGITNACTIVVAGMVNNLAATQFVVSETDLQGVLVFIATNGSVYFQKSSLSTLVSSPLGTIVAGVPFVLTARLSGGTAVIRLNGAQVATAATAQVLSATTGMRVGGSLSSGALPLNGALGWVVPLPTALSDADCLMVERLVSSQFPNGPVF